MIPGGFFHARRTGVIFSTEPVQKSKRFSLEVVTIVLILGRNFFTVTSDTVAQAFLIAGDRAR
jgi:hypothetical protein